MIKFETSRFGTLEVEDDRIISFPYGILGFSNLKRYILLDYKDTQLKWLQAVDDPRIAFIVLEPTLLNSDFPISIDNECKRLLQLANDDNLAVLVIVRVDADKVIANLNGPLILNASLMLGMQIVVDKN